MFAFYVQRKLVKWEAHEVDGLFFENEAFSLSALPMQHGIPCLGYRFQEKRKWKLDMKKLKKLGVPAGAHLKKLQQGKDIVYKGTKVFVKDVATVVEGKGVAVATDTKTCKNIVLLAKGADLFLCESTYADDMKDEAHKRKHMTAKEAATLAKEAEVKQLVLVHFSQRYKNVKLLEKEAKTIFKKTVAGEDFQSFSL